MPTRFARPTTALAVSFAAVAAFSCSSEPPTAAAGGHPELHVASTNGKVAICHNPAAGGRILQVAAPAVAAHLAHGDYLATLYVSHDPAQPSDGAHFARIGDALRTARDARLAHGELVSAACRITILVSADAYVGTAGAAYGDLEQFPLVADVPEITLRGALVMRTDEAGRATGQGWNGEETTLRPAEPLPVVAGASTPIIVANAHPGGSAGNGLTVEGFAFESGHDPAVDAGGQGVLALRANRLTIQGNRFGAGFTESIDLRAGGGRVARNFLEGTIANCDICLSGPGRYWAIGNRLGTGGIPGIVVSGVISLPLPSGIEALELPATAETWGVIVNNEVRDHLRLPVGTGVRVDAVGVGAPNVHNTIHAVIRHNLLVNNRFGMIVHAAFPVNGTDRRGDVDVTLGGNRIQQSCQAKLLVSLSRHTTALGLTNNPYLLNSTFRLSLHGDPSWDEAWYGHAAGFGNTLIVDGDTIPSGGRQFYDAAGCPGA